MQLQHSSKLANLPVRPRGPLTNRFRTLSIATNHFFVELAPIQKLNIFSIKYEPMIAFDNRVLKAQLMKEASPQIQQFIDHPVVSGNNIYSIRDPVQNEFKVSVGEHALSIKLVKTFDFKANPKLMLTFLNNSLRQVMSKLSYVEIGNGGKYFSMKNKVDIDNLMMFSGYKSNFALLEKGIYLRVDSAKKIVRNQTVLEVINELYKMHQDKDRDEKRNIIQNELVGKVIMRNYGNPSYHRIEEVVFDEVESTYLDDKSNTNLKQYYEQNYNIQIKNSKQPLLRVESKRRDCKFKILMVPELCLMTGIPQNFDEFRRKKISEQTIKEAGEKKREIQKLMTELSATEEFANLKQMGIKISRKMDSISGRIIPNPKITLGEHNSIDEGKEAFFNLFNKPIFASKHSIKVGLIYFAGTDTRPLIDTFESTSRNLHVKLEIQKLNAGEMDNRKAISAIEAMIKKAVESKECNVCLIIIPNNLKSQYKKIKTIALVQYKVICQITTEGTLRKKNLQSIATKILLQIIAKRGNTLWVPKSLLSSASSCMLVGMESSKLPTGALSLSLCATINSTFSSIFSKNLSYSGMENKFKRMTDLMMEAMGAYVNRNKDPPNEVIIFHSSVSGDQIVMFEEHFISGLKAKLSQIYGQKAPLLTLILVNVKTSQRFFTEGEQARNVPAGTLITTSITSQSHYDFYLVSQGSNRGSTLPNHYKVIHSDSKMEEGVLQELIYGQCFNYVNWTGSIKVPGILQYAQRCARFNAQVLEDKQICEELQNKLYFV